MNKTHSFSTKGQEDFDFVEKLKKKSRLTGRNFSWLVVEALKEYTSKRDEVNADKRKN